MTRLVINTGSAELAGDGESIYDAFNKVNTNFTELYGNLQNAIPNVTNNNGKFLTTDGNVLSWISLPPNNQLINGTAIASLETDGTLSLPAGGKVTIGGEPISANITTGPVPPVDVYEGKLWFDSISGRMYIYYRSAWIDSSPRGTVSMIANGTKTPSSAGRAGEVSFDANWIYICVATNTWKRAPLSGGF